MRAKQKTVLRDLDRVGDYADPDDLAGVAVADAVPGTGAGSGTGAGGRGTVMSTGRCSTP